MEMCVHICYVPTYYMNMYVHNSWIVLHRCTVRIVCCYINLLSMYVCTLKGIVCTPYQRYLLSVLVDIVYMS